MNFDRVARCYRYLEYLVYGPRLQRARVAHLAAWSPGEKPRALVLGDGDGRFLEALMTAVPGAEVDCVEPSAAMLELARQRLPSSVDVRFHQVDFDRFEASGRYDLVVSHFLLDCFREEGIRQLAEKVAECCTDGGSWLIADFQVPPRGRLRRWRARVLLRGMYLFFRLGSGLRTRALVDPAPILLQAGFRLDARHEFDLGFVRSDHWKLAPLGARGTSGAAGDAVGR